MVMLKSSIDKEETGLSTLAEFYIDEAKKVYYYNDGLIDKIKNNDDIEREKFSWQILILNTLGENGTIYLEENQFGGELSAKAMEFPLDNRKMILSNEEIANDYIDDGSRIEEVYFINYPISRMVTVVATVKLDTEELLFVTIEDVKYYNGMELGQVYTFDDIVDCMNSLD